MSLWKDRKLSNRKLGSGYTEKSVILFMTLEQRNVLLETALLQQSLNSMYVLCMYVCMYVCVCVCVCVCV